MIGSKLSLPSDVPTLDDVPARDDMSVEADGNLVRRTPPTFCATLLLTFRLLGRGCSSPDSGSDLVGDLERAWDDMWASLTGLVHAR